MLKQDTIHTPVYSTSSKLTCVPIGINCAPLVVDLFLFWYNILNTDNSYFEQNLSQLDPTDLQLY